MKIVNEYREQLDIQKSNPIKVFFMLILGAVLLVYVISTDYCFERHQKLTNKEYISIVLNGLLKSGKMKTHNWDKTVDSYLAYHPDCCRFFRSGSFYNGAPVVEITYEMSDKSKKYYGSNNTHYQDLSVLTACGEHLDSTGETTTPLNKFHTTN